MLGLLNKVKNLGKSSLSDTGAVSPQTLQYSDFSATDVAIIISKENIIGEMSINPQTRQAFGFGSANFSDNQGTIHVDLEDTAAATLEGEVILSVQDYNGNNNKVVYRGQLEDLRSGATDITKRVKFPLTGVFGNENDKLVFKFIPSSVGNGTVDLATSKLLIASSVQYLGRI